MTEPGTGPVDALALTVAREDAPAGWQTRLHGRPLDFHETPDRTVAVLGRLRRPGGGPLTAEALVRSGAVHGRGIDADGITGNGLVVSMDRRRPVVHAYRTLLGLPQLYFHAGDDRLLLATSLPDLLDRGGPFDPDPEATAEHFTFRFVLPPRTYYRGVGSLPGGHLLTWDDGALHHRRVKQLTPARTEPITRMDADAIAWLDAEMQRILASYVDHAVARGRAPVTLLSGGVDSVLVHLWANGAGPDATGAAGGRSCSFTVPEAPSFGAESRRAVAAAARLGADHRAVPVAVADYPRLLEATVALLRRPALFNEAWPCHLALGRAVRDAWGADLTLFGGHCADGLHGLGELLLLDAMAPFGDPLRGPTAVVSLAGELPWLLEAFGEVVVREVFDRRRDQADRAAPTDHPWERMHMTHYFAAGTEPSTAAADLYGALGLDLAVPYRDEELAATIASFHPDTRYLTRRARGSAVPGNDAPALKPLQTALLDARGLGALARVEKGGTTFWWDLWRWMVDDGGPLRDRVMAIRRPDFLDADAFDRLRAEPSDFLWNLLVYDEWRRTLRDGP